MSAILHITSGDCCGGSLAKAGLPGEVFVWHDVLYEGPRNSGWPTAQTLKARARFLEKATAGGLDQTLILKTLKAQYKKLEEAGTCDRIVLWFDACLFDMAMLVHVMACLKSKGHTKADLLVVDRFPGIEPYDGLGQLSPAQMAAVYDQRQPVTAEQWDFAELVDADFARQDWAAMVTFSQMKHAPLKWVPAAAGRWVDEQPEPDSGLGLLERLALEAIRGGTDQPAKIMAAVSARDSHPLFWGDTTLWAKINGLAARKLVKIEGPAPKFPQWEGQGDLNTFRCVPWG